MLEFVKYNGVNWDQHVGLKSITVRCSSVSVLEKNEAFFFFLDSTVVP